MADTEHMEQVQEIADVLQQSLGLSGIDALYAGHAVMDAGWRKDHELIESWRKTLESVTGNV